MKALIFDGDHAIALEEKTKITIQKSTDAIVRVTKAAICGTDLGIYKGKNREGKKGTILGYEGEGIVEEVGSSVTKLKKEIK